MEVAAEWCRPGSAHVCARLRTDLGTGALSRHIGSYFAAVHTSTPRYLKAFEGHFGSRANLPSGGSSKGLSPIQIQHFFGPQTLMR
jgi:hypothetical protein